MKTKQEMDAEENAKESARLAARKTRIEKIESAIDAQRKSTPAIFPTIEQLAMLSAVSRREPKDALRIWAKAAHVISDLRRQPSEIQSSIFVDITHESDECSHEELTRYDEVMMDARPDDLPDNTCSIEDAKVYLGLAERGETIWRIWEWHWNNLPDASPSKIHRSKYAQLALAQIDKFKKTGRIPIIFLPVFKLAKERKASASATAAGKASAQAKKSPKTRKARK